jgi:hypothetical protein
VAMSQYRFAVNGRGAPLLLAPETEAPPEPPTPEPDDTRAQRSVTRRRDAIADAARTLDDLSPAGVESFVRRRWRGDRAVAPEDFSSFSTEARQQRLHDVVDALDFRIRRTVNGRASVKHTHVSVPRGRFGKALASLDREELAQAFERLRERGWSNQEIARHGVRRFDKDGNMRKLIGQQ